MMSGCAAGKPYGPESYVVRPQDTVYSIAWRHDLDYRDLAKWNNIGSDYRLVVGQVLVLGPRGRTTAPRAPFPAPTSSGSSLPTASQPNATSRPQGVPLVGKPTPLADAPTGNLGQAGTGTLRPHAVSPTVGAAGAVAPSSVASSSASSAARPAVAREGGSAREPESAPREAVGGTSKWVWPTDRSSPPRPVPGGGILLFGRLGQDVRATGMGRVVYTGSGIRGYGNLIIIKHGDSMLSSYAHNREMLVHEGQDVLAGQVIAHMGTGPHQVSALYFEIRVNGKPTDPLRYLPGAK
jgi:lipoprotein NlpD